MRSMEDSCMADYGVVDWRMPSLFGLAGWMGAVSSLNVRRQRPDSGVLNGLFALGN